MKTKSISDFKYRIVLFGLVAQLALNTGIVFFIRGDWALHIENFAIAVVAAWSCEEYVQRRLRIKLTWFGPGERDWRQFWFSVAVLAGAFWLALPSIQSAQTVVGFVIGSTLSYLFAAAVFEVGNLVKVGKKK